jgi:hypothetical protein
VADRRPINLGTFETFAEARQVYRQAALRNRIVAELSAAWAQDLNGMERSRHDNGSLDRRLLDLLLETSRPAADSRRRKRPPHPENEKARGKSPPTPRSRRSTQSTSASQRPRAKRS